MKLRTIVATAPFVLLIAFHVGSVRLEAGLGEPADSINSDRTSLGGTNRKTTPHTGYTVDEFQTDCCLVREYSNQAKLIFGVAWNGLTHPHLAPLLGAYKKDYEETLKQTKKRPGGRRHQKVKGGRLVIERSGHQRQMRGHAFDPALLPAGVTPDAIQ